MRNHVSKVHANSAPVARDGLRNCEERKQVVVLVTTVPPEHQGRRSHGRHPGGLAKLTSHVLFPDSPSVLSINATRSLQQCVLFCARLQNGSTTVLWFSSTQRVKTNMKYLLSEQAE